MGRNPFGRSYLIIDLMPPILGRLEAQEGLILLKLKMRSEGVCTLLICLHMLKGTSISFTCTSIIRPSNLF